MAQRRLDDPCHLGGGRHEDGPALSDRDDRRHVETRDGDPESIEDADHPHAGGHRIERDLLVRLAQRRGNDVGIAALRLAAREADLARVMAATMRAFGQDDEELRRRRPGR